MVWKLFLKFIKKKLPEPYDISCLFFKQIKQLKEEKRKISHTEKISHKISTVI